MVHISSREAFEAQQSITGSRVVYTGPIVGIINFIKLVLRSAFG
jgi:hypothetical protein